MVPGSPSTRTPSCSTTTATRSGPDPVSGHSGQAGQHPGRYYKDEKKTAETFRTINGALRDSRRLRDGRGGRHRHHARPRLGVDQHRREKVYPRRSRPRSWSPDVFDALVVGVPDERVTVSTSPRWWHRAPEPTRRYRLWMPSCATTLPVTRCRGVCGSSTRSKRSPAGKPDYTWAGTDRTTACRRGPHQAHRRRLMHTELCDRFDIDYPIFVFTPSERSPPRSPARRDGRAGLRPVQRPGRSRVGAELDGRQHRR